MRKKKEYIIIILSNKLRDWITSAWLVCVLMMGGTASQDENLAQLSKVSKENYVVGVNVCHVGNGQRVSK